MDRIKKTALLGLMLAGIITLQAFEQALPPLPFLPPGVKLGLSNAFIMYAVFFIGKPQTFCLCALKSYFVFLTRGPSAGILSLSGGLLSVIVIILLLKCFKTKVSYTSLSIFGAITHNIGQYAVVSALLGHALFAYYLPALIISGVLTGFASGVLLRAVMPALSVINLKSASTPQTREK